MRSPSQSPPDIEPSEQAYLALCPADYDLEDNVSISAGNYLRYEPFDISPQTPRAPWNERVYTRSVHRDDLETVWINASNQYGSFLTRPYTWPPA